jgi:putative methanogenesis marker protein 8
MISLALKKKAVDSAVIVCEGAGTVITDKPEMVQGIGARMNSIIITSPINGIIKKLKDAKCHVIYENALINQIDGVKAAIKIGYKSIAVTVSGNSAGALRILRDLEKMSGVRIVIFVVCTTNISHEKVEWISEHADLVWSCASSDIRRMIGPAARCQLSKQIPVFVLTQSGMDIISAYAKEWELVKSLNANKQYLFSSECGGQCVHLGNFKAFISESQLPVHSQNEPCFIKN